MEGRDRVLVSYETVDAMLFLGGREERPGRCLKSVAFLASSSVFYREHGPPHFHAVYGEFEITVEIVSGVVTGRFPKRALGHVLEWTELHRDELLENWNLARDKKPLKAIAPLE